MTNNTYQIQFSEAYHTRFAIPEYLTSRLSLYKISKWSASYFISQWESNIDTYAAGTIRKYNLMFHVNFCSSCSLDAIRRKLKDNPNLQIALSFRKADKLSAYVLVDFIRENRNV